MRVVLSQRTSRKQVTERPSPPSAIVRGKLGNVSRLTLFSTIKTRAWLTEHNSSTCSATAARQPRLSTTARGFPTSRLRTGFDHAFPRLGMSFRVPRDFERAKINETTAERGRSKWYGRPLDDGASNNTLGWMQSMPLPVLKTGALDQRNS